MEHNVGGYNILHPLEGLHLPPGSDKWPYLVSCDLDHKARNIITDEIEPEERVGFLISALDSVNRLGLKQYIYNFPDHFVPGARITMGTSLQGGWEAINAMYAALMSRAEEGFTTRGLLMTDAYNRAFQLGNIEFGFSNVIGHEPDVKLLLAYPLRMDYWKMHELPLPEPHNGVVSVTTVNRLRRDSLLEFFTAK